MGRSITAVFSRQIPEMCNGVLKKIWVLEFTVRGAMQKARHT
jgi:hypothetical protein